MMVMSQISITVDNLHKKMGATLALKGITTRFEPARLHGIIGPDGAGKTTFIRILVGLLTPNQGSIQFYQGEQPIAFQSIRPKIAYMPQQQSLYADLSVGEHLDFFKDMYVIPSEVYITRRAELLRLTRMEPFQDRVAGKLSGGMYKKLGLMCALLQSPDVVFLDEPTNGVDPISRREFWELLYRLLQQKILVIISTAYMDEAERCSRVHVLEEGRILSTGEPRSILKRENVDNFEDFFVKYSERVKP
ncbi:ABC transporter ATP-binding protein [bacterium]|nr:ABC transporter ATP-binding protein [bacterium]